jgi:hypothetical protein
MKNCLLPFLVIPVAAAALPAPQFVENRSGSLQLRKGEAIAIVTGHEPNRTVGIAADMIAAELGGFTVRRLADAPLSGIVIVLRNCEREGISADASAADRELLATGRHFGQSYILEASSRGVRISGATGVGVLYGAATLIQLLQPDSDGLQIQATLIRDYPSFRYRAASDWVLRAELNRWAYDWGDGVEAYVKRIHRKLDFCARFKINMVMFDGFGWSTARRPGYAAMMREFNGYARDRGIKLIFAGFGANFDPRKVEPEFHIGRVILNRRSYPYGPVYQCFGEDRTTEHPTYGTCRSNDALLHQIASDFENFVRAVEPGALYVHHEDTGNFQSTQLRWAARCDECKRRWPNPDFAAADGGAGAMARGYENILRAVNSVRNTTSGYEALRDCTVVFISPPYGIDSNRSGMGKEAVDPSHNWNKTLEFWTNVLAQMPKAPNVEVGFREIFAGSEGKQWIEAYRSRMLSRGLNPNTFLFFLGGADQYSDGAFGYPFTGSAVMDEIFDGAESIYSFNGGLHQEPQQVINAQYAWNSHAPGHIAPASFEGGLRKWHALLKNEELPGAIFAVGGVFDSACAKIYGVRAGAAMSRFQRFNEGRTSGDLPPFYPAKIYPVSVLWRLLEGDALYVEAEPSDAEKKALDTLHLSRGELQSRLAAFWRQCDAVNKRGRNLLAEVSAAGDLRSDAQEDVQRLRLSLEAGEHIAALMTIYHSFLAGAASAGAVESEYRSTLAWLHDHVRADFVDPKGGDASSWFEAVEAVRSRRAGRSM